MARQTGKAGRLKISTTRTVVSAEVATLNASPVTIGGKSFAALQVATLANKFVIPDDITDPVSVTLAQGTGSIIPSDISWVVDHVSGRIIFSKVLTTGNTATVSYAYASGIIDLTVDGIREWSFDESVKEADVTAFQDVWERYVTTQKTWTASLTALLNTKLYEAASGATDAGAIVADTFPIICEFILNNATVSASNPLWIGFGFVSMTLKNPHSAVTEATAKIRGTGSLEKFTTTP